MGKILYFSDNPDKKLKGMVMSSSSDNWHPNPWYIIPIKRLENNLSDFDLVICDFKFSTPKDSYAKIHQDEVGIKLYDELMLRSFDGDIWLYFNLKKHNTIESPDLKDSYKTTIDFVNNLRDKDRIFCDPVKLNSEFLERYKHFL